MGVKSKSRLSHRNELNVIGCVSHVFGRKYVANMVFFISMNIPVQHDTV